MVSPIPQSLSNRLREHTRALHTLAERSGVMNALLRGELDPEGYAALLRNLHALYASLEAGLRRCERDPRIGPLCRPGLFREAALANDLRALQLQGVNTDQPLQPAMQDYVVRLQTVLAEHPERLVAHAYVRYLGDLNGGQVLARIVGRAVSLNAREGGLDFYQFGDPASVAAQAASFRQALDMLPLTALETERVLDEAQWAFRQHAAVFEELGHPA